MNAALDVNELVENVSWIMPPNAEAVGLVLGATLTPKPSVGDMMYYEAALSHPHFESADLRINTKSQLGILVLRPRSSAPLLEGALDLRRYGRAKSANVNPDIPPEGTTELIFGVRAVDVTFQLTAKSRVLRVLSFSWAPRTEKKKAKA